MTDDENDMARVRHIIKSAIRTNAPDGTEVEFITKEILARLEYENFAIRKKMSIGGSIG